MSAHNEGDTQTYKVLVNVEEQYGYWPSFKKEVPPGWRETGVEGTKEICDAYTKETWTDMRPLSLRKQME